MNQRFSFLYFLFLFPLFLSGQYSGSIGDGSDAKFVTQVNLDGTQVNTIPMYIGGKGDGHISSIYSATLSGGSIEAMFKGGLGEGTSVFIFNATLSGGDLSQMYSGGNGDGHNNNLASSSLGGVFLDIIYAGGEGDGMSFSNFRGVTSGDRLSALYQGGESDGHDIVAYSGTPNGQKLDVLYAGGLGDGHTRNKFEGIIQGTPLRGLYSGGRGDGFSRNVLQFIFVISDCTIVENTNDDGLGSLRYAIDCASSGGTISFSPSLLLDTIKLSSAPISISKEILIQADKAAQIYIDGRQLERAIQIGINAVTISGINILGGQNTSNGAILNNGFLVLEDVELIDGNGNSISVIETNSPGSISIKGTVRIRKNNN